MEPAAAVTIQRLAQSNNALWAKVRELESGLAAAKGPSGGRSLSPLTPVYVEDIPGKRVPYTQVAQGTFSATSANTRTAITFQVSQDGPFVCTWVSAYWRVTSGSPTGGQGRWRPISSLFALQPDGAGGTFTVPDVVDFEYEVQQGGADRNWQNIALSSRDLYGEHADTRPHYLGIAGFLERNEVVTINVTMTRNPTTEGLLKFHFVGYKILQPISFAG